MRIGALFLIVLLAGCSAEGESYGSIDELREAYVAAGGDCDGWRQWDQIPLAAESGVCDGDTVLSTYSSQDAKEEIVAGLKSAAAEIGGFGVLVGENWIINSPDAEDVQAALGGTLVADG